MNIKEFLTKPQRLYRVILNRQTELEKLEKLSQSNDLYMIPYQELQAELEKKCAEYAEASKNVNNALEQLEPLEYEIVYSKYIEGKTMQEISESIMYGTGQTYNYLNKAKKRLEKYLNN